MRATGAAKQPARTMPSTFSLLSQTALAHQPPAWLPVSSPTLDLSVTWDSAARALLILRPPGQIVSKIVQHGRPSGSAPPPEPQAVAWRPDGQFIAVAWSDGCVRIMGLENSKAAHQIRLSGSASSLPSSISSASEPLPSSQISIGRIAWVRSLVGRRAAGLDAASVDPVWRKLLLEEMNAQRTDHLSTTSPLDLPAELFLLEIDSSLPKLSALPSSSAGSGEDAILFTLQTGIDFLFQPLRQESEQIDLMIVGTTDGRVHLSVFDSFVVGSFDLPWQGNQPVRLVHSASHMDVSTQYLFVANSPLTGPLLSTAAGPGPGPVAIYLIPMDLAFLASSPVHLSLLTFKLTTLQTLLRYLQQTSLHMLVELKNAREIPDRYLRAIRESLAAASEGPHGVVQALFHAALTGHSHEPLREWFADILAERGHKRWDKAVTSSLQNLRSIVHENLLPALDRVAIILSRLRGLAQFHHGREDLGFSAAQVRRALDAVAGLTLVAHRILLLTMEELGHFAAFSAWLRLQVDRATSPTAEDGDDMLDREAAADVPGVLAYVDRFLALQDPLSVFLDADSGRNAKADADANALINASEPYSLVQLISLQLRRHEDGQPFVTALPQLSYLLGLLSHATDAVFHGVSTAQQRSVHFRDPVLLSSGRPVSMFDTMVATPVRQGADIDVTVYSALVSDDSPSQVWLFRTTMRVLNSISTAPATLARPVRVHDGRVVQLSFLDGRGLLVLCQPTDDSSPVYMVLVHVQSDRMAYVDWTPGHPAPPALVLPSPGLDAANPQAPAVAYALPDALATPAKGAARMSTHSASEARGHVPARVGLLAKERTAWTVLEVSSQS